jgi:protein-S-isoprenylcysteine O-methyltransferase Ste14
MTLATRVIVRTVVSIACMGAVLFAVGGALRWTQAWVFLAAMLAAGLALGLWLARYDPALLRERMAPLFQRGQKVWDKAFVVALIVLWPPWYALIALDAARFRWSRVPIWLQIAGALMISLCIYIVYLTFRENSYAAPVVRIQSERGHHLIDTGPYGYVRHPMYAGALLFIFGTPLLLGSWYGLAAALFIAALIALRAVLEERALTEGLEGYRDYAARVRYRLIPMIW